MTIKYNIIQPADSPGATSMLPIVGDSHITKAPPAEAELLPIEIQNLKKLEKELEQEVTMRLEAQSSKALERVYTAEELDAQIAETVRHIAAVESAMGARRKLEAREARFVPNRADSGDKQSRVHTAELPETQPNERNDSEALVPDSICKNDISEVDDPVNEVDAEEAVIAELPTQTANCVSGEPRPPQPDIIRSTSNLIIYVLLFNVMLWAYTYWGLSRQIYLTPTCLFVWILINKDSIELYRSIRHFWLSENPESIALLIISRKVVPYVSMIKLTAWYGPTAALCIIWIVPFIIKWSRWCLGSGFNTAHDFSNHVPSMQGPFPRRTLSDVRATRIASFGVNTNSIQLSIIWWSGLNIIHYSLTYIVLFSRESLLAGAMAAVMSVFLRSRLCPRPRFVAETNMTFQLLQREFDATRLSGRIRCPSLGECFAQQCAACKEDWGFFANMVRCACGKLTPRVSVMTLIILSGTMLPISYIVASICI